MTKKYVSLTQDINDLLETLSQEENDEVYIFADSDKRKPQNSITYLHPESIPKMAEKKMLVIQEVDNNINEKAPNFIGLPFYKVKIISKSIKQKNKDIEVWPAILKWTDKTTFQLGDYGNISFAKNSDRLKIFKILTEKKTDWVEVREIHNRTNIPEDQIRTTINHIRKRLSSSESKLSKWISIIARHSSPGAYRIKILSFTKPQ